MNGSDGAVRRVAVVAYHASPLAEPGAGDAGGMTVYVRALAKALAERGVRTDIYTRATSDLGRVVHLWPGVRVVSIEAGPVRPIDKDRGADYLSEFVDGVRAFALSQRIRYDVVHSHYWQSGLAARTLAFSWGAPLVHSLHTLGKVKNRWLAPGDQPESQRRLNGEADVIAAADVVVASTDDEWQQLSCLYRAPHDSLKTLHPGVDHALFSPGSRITARATLGLGDGPILLYAGRIQRLKGLDLALRSLDILRRELDTPATLMIVGGVSGSRGEQELKRLESLASELGLEESVRFVGPQPHAMLPEFYRASDAVVVCSYSESFGLTALEAHACAIPVVATSVGGLSHIVSDGVSGFLVDDRDPTTFAKRLQTLLADENLYDQMGRAAVRRADDFSWDSAAEEFQELYECLVREELVEACTC